MITKEQLELCREAADEMALNASQFIEPHSRAKKRFDAMNASIHALLASHAELEAKVKTLVDPARLRSVLVQITNGRCADSTQAWLLRMFDRAVESLKEKQDGK